MAIGDVVWIDFPSVGGHEQAGRRPSIVIQDDTFASRSPLVITVPLTTASSTFARFPAVIPLTADTVNGLMQDSFILVFQIRAIDRNRIRNRIGNIGTLIVSQIHQALDQLLGRSKPIPNS